MIKIPGWLASLGLEINRLHYKQLFFDKYANAKHPPAWFDHRIDLYYHWPDNLFWLERGILPRKHMVENCTILDLFCGDGFFSRYFYSTIASQIDAVDKDELAIAHALRLHSHPKINYQVIDSVTQSFPRPHYDVVVWFEGIEHLDMQDYRIVIQRIKDALGETGVLIGSTPIIPNERLGQGNWEHQNEFTDIHQLEKFLLQDFAEVQIEVTVYPLRGGECRRTAYFTLKQPR